MVSTWVQAAYRAHTVALITKCILDSGCYALCRIRAFVVSIFSLKVDTEREFTCNVMARTRDVKSSSHLRCYDFKRCCENLYMKREAMLGQ